jgi:ATP-dependent Clp protease, protease subunit
LQSQQVINTQNMWADIKGNEIKLYGRIWSGDGQFISTDIAPVLNANTDVIVRLHTPGGSVMDANLIYNTLIGSKANIHIIIDGLSASMGSILMLAGNKVSIAENGFVMIHAPSGTIEGNAKDMENGGKLLRSIESNFLKKYAKKTGKTEADLIGWMQGDNWFSADEALAAGLVDHIIDPVLDNMDVSAYTDYNLVALSPAFEKYDRKPTVETVDPNASLNPKIETNMKLNAKSLDVLGVSEGATDEQINAAIEANYQKRVTAETALRAQKDAQIEALISTAVADGRITASEKDEYKELAIANFELASKTINKLPVKSSINGGLDKSTTGKETGREAWTFQDWSKKDTVGLLKIKAENPEAYQELANKSGVVIK